MVKRVLIVALAWASFLALCFFAVVFAGVRGWPRVKWFLIWLITLNTSLIPALGVAVLLHRWFPTAAVAGFWVFALWWGWIAYKYASLRGFFRE